MTRRSLLTRQEAAAYLNVPERWMRRALEHGIPVVRVGRYPRFDPDDLDRWIDEQRVPARNGARR